MEDGLLTSERCLSCEVCCRFPTAGSAMAPVFSPRERDAASACGLPRAAFCNSAPGRSEPVLLVRSERQWACPAFDVKSGKCRIYATRPLDCRLYPFVITCDEAGRRVWLAADLACPFVVENLCTKKFRSRAQVLAQQIDETLSPVLGKDPAIVVEKRPEFECLLPLEEVTARVCRPDLGLARLTPGMFAELQPFFKFDPRPLAHHALAPILAWMDHFNLYYRVVEGRLLLFGEDGGGAFLWVPPVGRGALGPALEEARAILEGLGRRPGTWRMDNVAADQLPFLAARGLRPAERAEEFLYRRRLIANPGGRALHGMKSALNHFLRHHREAAFEPFPGDDIAGALDLYRRWLAARERVYADEFYRAQAESAMLMHYRVMRLGTAAGLVGRTLRADGRLVGYTFGYPLPGTETAVVFTETTDLEVKGASACIFREFARSWAPVEWLNAMGDSGLPNLRRAKMLYRPAALVPAWTVRPGPVSVSPPPPWTEWR